MYVHTEKHLEFSWFLRGNKLQSKRRKAKSYIFLPTSPYTKAFLFLLLLLFLLFRVIDPSPLGLAITTSPRYIHTKALPLP